MLMSGLDEISNIVLENMKLPSEKAKSIIPFLQKIKSAQGNPLAIVSDMSAGIASALKAVFSAVPHFICHYHFLRDIGKDMLGANNELLKRSLKSHCVKKRLRELAKKCATEISNNPGSQQALEQYLKGHFDGQPFAALPASVLTYVLTLWILNAKKGAQGNGFPFDRPHLTLYRRLALVDNIFTQKKTLYTSHRYLKNLREIVRKILADTTLQRVIQELQEREVVFDRLRKAMRIADPSSKKSLNDNGKISTLTPIKTALTAFRADPAIIKQAARCGPYAKMLQQIDKYWSKLFANPISIPTSYGRKLVYPQRTNNVLERLFRSLKRSLRRKTGRLSLNPTLKALLADTPLIQNLNNDQYLNIILNGKSSLEEAFADIDSQIVRDYLSRQNLSADFRISPIFKKILALPDLPQKLLVNTIS